MQATLYWRLNVMDDYWSPINPNPYAFWPRLSANYNENNSQQSTWWMRDGSFLRLKNVELGYTFPKSLVKKMKISKLRLYFSGNNLAVFSNFKLWDPEMAHKGGNQYPLQRVYNVGAQLSF